MKFSCPHCTQNLEIADEWSGQAVDCPSCQQALTVPAVPVPIPVREAAPKPPTKSQPPKLRRPAPGRSAPSKPPRRGGGGLGKLLLMLLVLGGAGFGYAMVRFNESPEQVWKRLVDFVETMVKPAPAPTPTPSPTPMPTPTPEATPEATPTPVATPEATPTPTPVDPMAWLLEHKEQAPKEIVLQRPASLATSLNGKVLGSVTVSAGARAQLVGFTAETVDVRVGNASGQVPLDATNLRTLAKAEQAKSALEVPPQPVPPVRPATTFPTPRFTHPSIPNTLEELATIKANLDKQPWKQGYALLADTSTAKLDWGMEGPCANVSRAGSYDDNLVHWDNSMNAVYNLARMWYFTGNAAYAQKAHDILIAWATTNTTFNGNEAGLAMGDRAHAFAGGADILRGTWPGWTAADTTTVKNYFLNVLWPNCQSNLNITGPNNKGDLAMVAGIAIAVFCDDTAKFNHVVNLYRTHHGAGLTDTLPNGQHGETGRDLGHAFGTVNALAFTAEVAWKQGVDLFSELDNRLLACGEYYCRNTYASDNPYIPFGTTDWQWLKNAAGPYVGDREGFYILQNAYKNRFGLPTPWIDRKLQDEPVNNYNWMFAKTADLTTATVLPPVTYPAVSPASSGLTLTTFGSQTSGRNLSYANGTWTLSGLGNGTWNDTTDDAQFAYKKMTGDCAMVARVVSFTKSGTQNGKTGLMIRDTLKATTSQRAFVDVTWVDDGSSNTNAMEDMIRGSTQHGGFWDHSDKWSPAPALPYWLKIERWGKQVTTFVSLDGASWSPMSCGYYANLPSTIYLGLFLCSGTTTAQTATFDHVEFTGGSGGPVTTPNAPKGILASGSHKVITVRWLASHGATAYDLLRSTTSSSGYTVLASNLSTARTSYVDATAAPGTTYYYVVRAKNAVGVSGNSPQFGAALIPPSMGNLAFSGTSTASFNQDSATEGPAKAFDSDPGTKWFGYNSPTGWIQYDFGAGNAQVIKRYTINSADVPARDPKDWQFQGSQDGSTWTTLDTQSGQSFLCQMAQNTYSIGNTTTYRYYRLNVTANHGDPGMAISELGLWSDSGRTIPEGRNSKHAKP